MEFNKVEVARFLLYGLILSCLVVSAVHAETLTGTLGGTTSSYTNYVLADAGGIGAAKIQYLYVNSIEYSQFTKSLVRFNFQVDQFTAATPVGNTSTFKGYVGAIEVCNGTIGYQRIFNGLGVEQPGYTWMVFNKDWYLGGLTGDRIITLQYQSMDSWIPKGWQMVTYPVAAGDIYLAYDMPRTITGSYTRQQSETASNNYTFTKPSGIGIVGNVAKSTPSRVYISNGTPPFSIITSDATVNTQQLNLATTAESLFVSMYTTGGTWYNSSVLFSPSVAPTAYYITVVPDTITYTGAAIGTIVSGGGDLTKITDISWSWADSTGSYDFNYYGNASRPLDYTLVGATWYGYEVGSGGLGGGYTLNMGGTAPNPVILNNLSSSGLKTITCFIGTSDHLWYSLVGNLTVDSSGMQTLTMQAKDFSTGALVAYDNMAVKKVSTGVWTNVTASGGTYNFLFPYNTALYIESTATGYAKTTKNYTTSFTPTDTLWLIMYSGTTPAAGNVTTQIYVYDGYDNSLIPGALVHVYQTGTLGDSQLTSGSGTAVFNLSQLSTYKADVTKYAYDAGSLTFATGAGGAIIDEVIILHRTAAPTPTVTIPTVVPSGVPTMVGGNYTGFWGPFYNMWGAMGANALTMQLLMACFFVFVGVVVGGFGVATIIPGAPYTALGAEAGGVFAFILACAFGFVSLLWIVVIFIWLAFRIFLITR